jgi:hypothetical protein
VISVVVATLEKSPLVAAANAKVQKLRGILCRASDAASRAQCADTGLIRIAWPAGRLIALNRGERAGD